MKDKGLKILFILTRSDKMGGASVHLLDLAENLSVLGYNCSILVGKNGVFIDQAKNRGLKCTSLKYLVRSINPLMDFLAIFEIAKKIKHEKPDLVHLHSSKAGIVGRLACKVVGVPVILTVHGWSFTEGITGIKPFLFMWLEKLTSGMVNSFITVSEFDKNIAIQKRVVLEDKITVIKNGVPFYDMGTISRTHNGPIKLIMVARFDEQKNQSDLIRSLSIIKNENWTLDLIGDGDNQDFCKRLSTRLGVSEKINFLGVKYNVKEYLDSADVFLLISNWEGLPLTIIEAMRSSLPVIASNVGGVSELVENNVNGFLVQVGDLQGICSAVQVFIKNPQEAITFGLTNRKVFEEKYSLSKMTLKTISVYDKLLQ